MMDQAVPTTDELHVMASTYIDACPCCGDPVPREVHQVCCAACANDAAHAEYRDRPWSRDVDGWRAWFASRPCCRSRGEPHAENRAPARVAS